MEGAPYSTMHRLHYAAHARNILSCAKAQPDIAGWSSLVARRAHNPEVVGSNPAPATKTLQLGTILRYLAFFVTAQVHVSYERCGVAAEERLPHLCQQPINDAALLNTVMVRRADAVQGEQRLGAGVPQQLEWTQFATQRRLVQYG